MLAIRRYQIMMREWQPTNGPGILSEPEYLTQRTGALCSLPGKLDLLRPPLHWKISAAHTGIHSTCMPGGIVRLHLNVVPGHKYAIQTSVDLAHWDSLATRNATGYLLELTDSAPDGPVRFYRAVEGLP